MVLSICVCAKMSIVLSYAYDIQGFGGLHTWFVNCCPLGMVNADKSTKRESTSEY